MTSTFRAPTESKVNVRQEIIPTYRWCLHNFHSLQRIIIILICQVMTRNYVQLGLEQHQNLKK